MIPGIYHDRVAERKTRVILLHFPFQRGGIDQELLLIFKELWRTQSFKKIGVNMQYADGTRLENVACSDLHSYGYIILLTLPFPLPPGMLVSRQETMTILLFLEAPAPHYCWSLKLKKVNLLGCATTSFTVTCIIFLLKNILLVWIL